MGHTNWDYLGTTELALRNSMKTYHLNVFEAEEGGFWADVAELPACAAHGENLDELMQNARDAIEAFLEVMAEEGEEPIGDSFVANLEIASPTT